jgi:hypothetical protein
MTAPIPINLAFEDQLIEEIITKVLAHVPRKYAPRTIYNRGGNGYLRTNIRGFNNAAKGVPFLVVTDLDTIECPATLIENWLGDKRHPNLLLRVAVREAEAWLLADAEELAKFLRIRAATIPGNPDSLIDPKKQLIALAGGSPSSEIRKDICPRSGSTSRVGPKPCRRCNPSCQVHAAHAVALRPMERTSFSSKRIACRRARRGRRSVAVGERGRDQFVALLDVDGDDAALHHVREVFQLGLLHRAVAGGEEDVLAFFFQVAHGEHGAHGFARLQADQVADVLALAGGATSGISYTLSQ